MTNKEMIKQIDDCIDYASMNLAYSMYSEDASGNKGQFDGLIVFYETTLKALYFQKKMLEEPSEEMLVQLFIQMRQNADADEDIEDTDSFVRNFIKEEKYITKGLIENVSSQALKELETEEGN